MCKTTVVNIKDKPEPEYDFYIGRGQGSKLGNPFSHLAATLYADKCETRDEAIEKYTEWVFTQPQILDRLPELKGKILACFCSPLACHGHVLAKLADSINDIAAYQAMTFEEKVIYLKQHFYN
jgi:hypothetical protein